ncbi:MAG: FeS-binding protein, partial [Mycobacterium sp.]
MDTQTLIRLVVGLGMTAIVGLFAIRRVGWLTRLTLSGQPATGRTDDVGERIWTQIAEVFGQRRLLKWSIPGLAHFFTMWAFFILLTVYIEAYGLLFQPDFHIPIIGRWDVLGFIQDFFIVAVTVGIATFAVIRILRNPREIGRNSRFYGSHNGGAWLILIMIFNVVWTFLLLRGAAVNNGTLPYGKAAFVSHGMGALLRPLGHTGNEYLEPVALLLHIG